MGSEMCIRDSYVTTFNRETATHWIANDTDGDGNVLSYSANIPSSTLLQSQWDWFTQDGRGKHSKPQQTFRYRRSFIPQDRGDNPDHDRADSLVVTKQKARGRGKEFRLRWSSEDHNDSHIVGWSLEGLVNQTI